MTGAAARKGDLVAPTSVESGKDAGGAGKDLRRKRDIVYSPWDRVKSPWILGAASRGRCSAGCIFSLSPLTASPAGDAGAWHSRPLAADAGRAVRLKPMLPEALMGCGRMVKHVLTAHSSPRRMTKEPRVINAIGVDKR